MFPANNIWNTPVDDLPVHARSTDWVNSIGRNTGFHMDFGSGIWPDPGGGPIGIPYNVVGAGVPKVPVSFEYWDESDDGPYPIPASPAIEYGDDHHILIVDSSTCTLYEIYAADYSGGQWYGGSGAIWELNSNDLREDTWTSADAAGLPILPGLVRYDEILSGEINHAIRFTADETAGYIWPARHQTSDPESGTPPMGARFRLKASFDISEYPSQMQVILLAMKTYGIILADNGSDWYVSGAPDDNWDNDMLHLLDDITGDDFEAVDSSSLMLDPDSGATQPLISGSAGVAGVTLNYTDDGAQTSITDTNGNYSFSVSNDWSGTVTPTKACYIFNPLSRSYSNVITNQTAQNYTFTLDPGSGCAHVAVSIADIEQGTYGIPSPGSDKVAYSGLNNGPVQVAGTNSLDVLASTRVLFGGVSYSELMGFPAAQLTDEYIFPYYNNVAFNSQLRVGNLGAVPTTITVTLGATMIDSYTLGAGAATRKNYAGQNSGPLRVSSSATNILATIRALYNGSSYSELMGYPTDQLTGEYIFPYYNNVALDSQLRVSNLGIVPTTITVTLGTTVIDTYVLGAGGATRKNYAGKNSGPLRVASSATNIISTIRALYNTNSYSELMGYPVDQLTDEYWYPVYDNVSLDSQLRVSNVGAGSTTITVYSGGTQIDTYSLAAGAATRKNYAGENEGPLQVVSSLEPILSTVRMLYTTASFSSYYEMTGFPGNQLTTDYWFPWYNNVAFSSQLRMAVP